jgi:hypothetical protein
VISFRAFLDNFLKAGLLVMPERGGVLHSSSGVLLSLGASLLLILIRPLVAAESTVDVEAIVRDTARRHATPTLLRSFA